MKQNEVPVTQIFKKNKKKKPKGKPKGKQRLQHNAQKKGSVKL